MKDEIKEIRDYISCPQFGDNHYGKWGTLRLDQRKKIKALLDYITNLQEENKEWQMIFDTFSKRPYAHRYLEEKKKELGNDKIIGLDSEMVYKDYYDYKKRNEEAIEKCRNKQYETNAPWLIEFAKDVENILQGKSDE